MQLCPLYKCGRILATEESRALSVLEEMAKPWFCRPAVAGNHVGSHYQPVVMLQEFIALFQPFCCHPALNVTSPHPQKGQNAFHFLVCICLFRTVSALLRYVAMKLLLGGEYH